MPWYTRFSRFADVHIVYTQEGNNACGIASVMMCVFKVNKFAANGQAITIERNIYNTYGAVAGTAYDGTVYTFARKLAATLNQLNCGSWVAENVGASSVNDKLIEVCGDSGIGPTIDVKPVIVLVGWNSGGAHFVVVDTVRSVFGTTYATVCDPWDGQLRVQEIEAGGTFNYTTNETIQVNFGRDPTYSYGSAQGGSGNGWVIYPTS